MKHIKRYLSTFFLVVLTTLPIVQVWDYGMGTKLLTRASDSIPSRIQQILVLYDPLFDRGKAFEYFYEWVEDWLIMHNIKWTKLEVAKYNVTEEALEPYDAVVIPMITVKYYDGVISRYLDDKEWAILVKYPVFCPYYRDDVKSNWPHLLVGGKYWGRKGGDLLLTQMVRQQELITVPTHFGFDIDDLVRDRDPRVSLENLQHLTSLMQRHGVTAYAGIRVLDVKPEEKKFLVANQDVLIPTLHQHKEGQLGGDQSYQKQRSRWTGLIDKMRDQGFDIDYRGNGYCIPPNHAYNDETLRMLSEFGVQYIAIDSKEAKRAKQLNYGLIGLPRSMFPRMDHSKNSREDVLEAFRKADYGFETDWEGYKEYNIDYYLRHSLRRYRIMFVHDTNIVNDEPAIDLLDYFFTYFENRGNAIFVNSKEMGDYVTSHFKIINVTRTQRQAIIYVKGNYQDRILFVPDDPSTGYRMMFGDVQIFHEDNGQMVDYQIEKTTDYGVYLKLLGVAEGELPFIDNPADIIYEEGSVNHSITWSPWDAHPWMYTVTRNGSMVAYGSWDNSSIALSVDALSSGSYTYVCTVIDAFGNSANDSVTVVVVALVTTPVTTPVAIPTTTPQPPATMRPVMTVLTPKQTTIPQQERISPNWLVLFTILGLLGFLIVLGRYISPRLEE